MSEKRVFRGTEAGNAFEHVACLGKIVDLQVSTCNVHDQGSFLTELMSFNGELTTPESENPENRARSKEFRSNAGIWSG